MDSNVKNSPKIQWVKFGNVSNLHSVGADAVLVAGGSWLLVVSTVPPHREAIHHAEGGVQVAAGHRFLSCLAYAEKTKDPRVLVLVHPGFRVVRKLAGATDTKYHAMEFSDAELLVVLVRRVSGTEIVIWNWRTAEQVCVVQSAIQDPQHQISASLHSPVRVAEWNEHSMTVWQTHACYRKTFLSSVTVKWPSKVKTPLAAAWNAEGELLAQDSRGTLYTVNLETGTLQMESEFPNPKTYPDDEPPPPCLASHSLGVVLHAEGQLALLKRKVEGWAPAWIFPTQPLLGLVSSMSKDVVVGWTIEHQLVTLKGEKPSEIKVIYTYGIGFDIVGIIKPHSDKFVSYSKATGQLSLWSLTTGNKVTDTQLNSTRGLLTMAASPRHPFLVFGFDNGMVEILVVPSMTRKNIHPTRHAIDAVKFSSTGTSFCVCSKMTGEFFLIKMKSGNPLEVLGVLQSGYPTADYFTENSGKRLVVLRAFYPGCTVGAETIITYSLDEGNQTFFKEKKVSLPQVYLKIEMDAMRGIILAVPPRSRSVHLLDENFQVTSVLPSGHLLPRFETRVMGQIVATFGADGLVVLHTSGLQTESSSNLTLVTHHRVDGGVSFVESDANGSFLTVGGLDGSLVCYASGIPAQGTPKEADVFVDEETVAQTLPDIDETWLEQLEKERIAKLQAEYKDVKIEILERLKMVKQKVKKLIDENEICPKDETLPLAEFELDTIGRELTLEEGRSERLKAHEMECARIRVQDALASRIAEYTWSSVQTPARQLRSILPLAADPGVHSYALLHEESSTSKETQVWMEERMRLVRDFHAGDFFQPWIPRRDSELKAHTRESLNVLTMTRRDSVIAELTQTSTAPPPRLPGMSTSTHQFLPGRELPHSQLQVRTENQAKAIIYTTEGVIRKLMEWFNSEFAAVAGEKERELRGLAESRARLRHVAAELRELGAPCELQTADLAEPTWAPTEVPETLLKVEESELLAPPYFSPEELEQQRKLAEEEETRRQQELADDFRERALGVMMDGVLQKMWQNEIKKDLPKPNFMEERRSTDWTDEESRKAKNYQEAVEKLLIERDRYQKFLAAEFKELSASAQESGARFDEKLKKLSELKLRVESAVGQEQLNILRMRHEILRRMQMNRKEEEIKSAIAEAEKTLEILQDEAAKLQELIGEGRAAHETLLIRDKNLDKNCKKDFPEYSPIICEQLYKISKKRPALSGRAYNNPALLSELGRTILQGDEKDLRLPLPPECLDFLKATDLLDGFANSPSVVSEISWEALCRFRRVKIDSELKIRASAIEVGETEQAAIFWQKQMKSCKEIIYKKQVEMENLQSEKRMSDLDCEVQLVVPQRIVEVPTTGRLTDFSNAALLSRTVVDNVNQAIQRVGLQKVRAMQRACEFRKGIVFKEWEHEKFRMRVEDLRAQLDTLEHVHVTKELQDILTARARGVYEEKGFAHLESEIRAVNLRFEKSELGLIQAIENYDRKISTLDEQNAELDERIVGLNKSLGRRASARDVQAEEKEAKDTKIRMRNILRRGRLVARAHELKIEVAALQAERDMLSLKAHPTIVQKD